jgi:hypothetical protein
MASEFLLRLHQRLWGLLLDFRKIKHETKDPVENRDNRQSYFLVFVRFRDGNGCQMLHGLLLHSSFSCNCSLTLPYSAKNVTEKRNPQDGNMLLPDAHLRLIPISRRLGPFYPALLGLSLALSCSLLLCWRNPLQEDSNGIVKDRRTCGWYWPFRCTRTGRPGCHAR